MAKPKRVRAQQSANAKMRIFGNDPTKVKRSVCKSDDFEYWRFEQKVKNKRRKQLKPDVTCYMHPYAVPANPPDGFFDNPKEVNHDYEHKINSYTAIAQL